MRPETFIILTRWLIRSILTCCRVGTALLSLARARYFLNFYFWLDVLSTLSLFFDIPAIYDLAIHSASSGSSTGSGGTLTVLGSTINAAAKAGQILRLVRVARTSRAFASPAMGSEGGARRAGLIGYVASVATHVMRTASLHIGSGSAAGAPDARAGGGERVSRLGVKLSDLTTRRVICGVWCILLFLPLFNSSIYPRSAVNSFERAGLANINAVWSACAAGSAAGLPQNGSCTAFVTELVHNYVELTQARLAAAGACPAALRCAARPN